MIKPGLLCDQQCLMTLFAAHFSVQLNAPKHLGRFFVHRHACKIRLATECLRIKIDLNILRSVTLKF